MENKRINIVYKKVKDLIPYENNPRNNDGAVDYVANSIKEFGFKVPIVVNSDGVIVAGHTRYKACEKLGIKEVPCIIADDLTEEQIKAFRIADNKTGEKAGWDLYKLKIEIGELPDIDMTDFGFGDFEISALTEDMEPEPYDTQLMDEYSEHADDNLKSKRVIITYSTEEEETFLKTLFKETEDLKVNYKCRELIDKQE